MCGAGAGLRGAVSVEVTNNALDYTLLSRRFVLRYVRVVIVVDRFHCVWSCVLPPTVASIDPTTGLLWGATLVSVAGTQFLPRVSLICRFGTSGATGPYVAHASDVSVASVGHGGQCDASVSNNQDFTADAVPFVYQANANVTALSNTRGPACMLHYYCCSIADLRLRNSGRIACCRQRQQLCCL